MSLVDIIPCNYIQYRLALRAESLRIKRKPVSTRQAEVRRGYKRGQAFCIRLGMTRPSTGHHGSITETGSRCPAPSCRTTRVMLIMTHVGVSLTRKQYMRCFSRVTPLTQARPQPPAGTNPLPITTARMEIPAWIMDHKETAKRHYAASPLGTRTSQSPTRSRSVSLTPSRPSQTQTATRGTYSRAWHNPCVSWKRSNYRQDRKPIV